MKLLRCSQRLSWSCPFPLVGGRLGWGCRVWRALRCQRGFSLIETVMSISVLGTAAIALVSAMATGALGYRVVGNDMTAARLAVTQMDNTRAYTPYLDPPASYPIITPPEHYSLTSEATAVPGRNPSTLEKITVTVIRDGLVVKVLEDYKANR